MYLQPPKKFIAITFMCHGPLPFLHTTFLRLSAQILLDHVMDYVDLKLRLLRTSTSMVTLTFFSLMYTAVIM